MLLIVIRNLFGSTISTLNAAVKGMKQLHVHSSISQSWSVVIGIASEDQTAAGGPVTGLRRFPTDGLMMEVENPDMEQTKTDSLSRDFCGWNMRNGI